VGIPVTIHPPPQHLWVNTSRKRFSKNIFVNLAESIALWSQFQDRSGLVKLWDMAVMGLMMFLSGVAGDVTALPDVLSGVDGKGPKKGAILSSGGSG
jgi:hypothetical protein